METGQDYAGSPCTQRACVSLAVPGQALCIVHLQLTRRQPADTPIHCYACGRLIRIGAKWIVRSEGAFHLRAACLNAAPADRKVVTL